METTTMEVAVHKANIPLLNGETLRQFTMALRDSGEVFLKRKLNLSDKDSSYMVEAMADKAVFDVYKANPTVTRDRTQYFAVKYSRNKIGQFEFSDVVQVRRITMFEPIAQGPKAEVPLTKAKEQKAVWTTAFINNLPDAAFAAILPGGKKDAEGKTTPRALRLVPHHGTAVKSPIENGSVDLPHLRNGLARANQVKASTADKKKIVSHLQAHAKKLLPGAAAKKAKGSDGLAVSDSAFKKKPMLKATDAEVTKHTNVFGAGNWLWADSFLWSE